MSGRYDMTARPDPEGAAPAGPDTGQEEAFSRTDVETGRIDHQPGPPDTPSLAERDEAQTERQAPDSAGPGEPAG